MKNFFTVGSYIGINKVYLAYIIEILLCGKGLIMKISGSQ